MGVVMVIEATVITTIRPRKDTHGVAFSPDGRWLALATDEGTPVVEVATGQERLTVRPGSWRKRGVRGVAHSPDGHRLTTCGWDRSARIWDAHSGRELLRVGQYLGASVAFSPDGRWLAIGGGDTVRIWDAHSGKELVEVAQDRASGVAFSPDGRLLATGGGDKTARVWQLRERTES